ncbi:hypothetical protein [Streptomyces sp. NBC_01500]|uniref:hypothetical protein n=1 Tax=Streptomyces sp. NBC_01500 TaxID=2903886 RepID=UPI00224E6797|nr:hypothetical protein [Streptomyces sp. NBC_01500]MCX4547275.1 DUF2793 domain-containing protein [Streptomyces sp. NBC_01500]MCX4554195.1 DUF2793 domain-containing protein [Streptomyces sp. NBC_01500]MCX4554535.1 DUF2793 domain-containing protein [Streptomyces sp. NBC_01500]
MPLTDSYGQGVTYPTLTDKPNAQTLGQGIVDGLTPKVVMTFASAVVRGATIKKPAAGMVAWLKDVGRLEVFDGAGWVSFGYGTNAWKTIPLASGFTGNGNSNGTPQYRVVTLFGEDTIMLRGGLNLTYTAGNIKNNGVFNSTALPTVARPATLRTVPVACSAIASTVTSLKLDIKTNGDLGIVGTGGKDLPPWVSLSGVICSL